MSARATVSRVSALTVLLAFGAACSRSVDSPTALAAPTWLSRPAPLAPRAEPVELAAGFELEPFADSPLLMNPVALSVDDRGRVLVAETHRYSRSVFDVTQQTEWLDADRSFRTVADRRAFLEQRLGDTGDLLTRDSELVRALVDDDRDGRADRSTIVADGFRDPESGTAAGVLTDGTDVWFACVPDLWRFPAAGTALIASRRERLHTGFGVHIGVSGHDLHGLILGPDGRLYFSMGDRGAHLESGGAVTVDLPDTGAVFRCEPDGSGLEVYAVGLRNPQELAFDASGELFTADNDTAGDDRSRIIHVVRGGDYGWRAPYQHMPGFGPWSEEGLWRGGVDGHLPNAGFAAQGPAGLAFHPGVGFATSEIGRFVLCDFPKGIVSFGLEPSGASFVVTEVRELVRGMWATDVAFGPDGALYVADWIAGWARPDAARVHRLFASGALDAPDVVEVAELLRVGVHGRPTDQLAGWLGHPDQRVRNRAGAELARRGAEGFAALVRERANADSPIARLHAVWGLGIAVRRHGGDPAVLVAALDDADPIVRARAARLCAEAGCSSAGARLRSMLETAAPLERLEVAFALAAIGDATALPDLVAMIARDGDDDPFVLHAGVDAIRALAAEPAIIALAERAPRAARRAALLALRRNRSTAVAAFLDDPDPVLRLEAARAIYDEPIESAFVELADRLLDESLAAAGRRRAVGAARRLGRPIDAERLGQLAADPSQPSGLRTDALSMLGSFATAVPFDPFVGACRSMAPREPEPARRALLSSRRAVDDPAEVAIATAFVAAARSLRVAEAGAPLAEIASDPARTPNLRAAALEGLAEFGAEPALGVAVDAALRSDVAEMVEAGLRLAPRVSGAEQTADRVVELAAADGPVGVRRAAIRALAGVESPQGDAFLERALRDFGEVPSALRLDVLAAAGARGTAALRDLLASVDPPDRDRLGYWLPALDGGDVRAGRSLFAERGDVACARCHVVVGPSDGRLGPSLEGLASRRTATEILESVVFPAAQLTAGHPNAMPAGLAEVLGRDALRDLVAYLRSLR